MAYEWGAQLSTRRSSVRAHRQLAAPRRRVLARRPRRVEPVLSARPRRSGRWKRGPRTTPRTEPTSTTPASGSTTWTSRASASRGARPATNGARSRARGAPEPPALVPFQPSGYRGISMCTRCTRSSLPSTRDQVHEVRGGAHVAEIIAARMCIGCTAQRGRINLTRSAGRVGIPASALPPHAGLPWETATRAPVELRARAVRRRNRRRP